MIPLRQRVLTTSVLIAGLTMVGCSSDGKTKPSQSPAPTPSTSTPPPHYSFSKVKASLLKPDDLGSGWKPYYPPAEQRIKNVSSCSLTTIKLPGDPDTVQGLFGAPDHRFKGANYATYIAVYDDEKEAAAAFDVIKKATAKCPSKRFVPYKKLPQRKFTYSHNDEWALTADSMSGWTHLRGTEKDVYPPSIGLLSVWHLMHDYLVRGNVVFTSLYWQILEPKKSAKGIEKRANELLKKQLEKLG